MIGIRGVKKAYGKTVALSEVTADIPTGAVFGVIGINGAGKSTLLRILAGVMQADDGEVLYDGQPLFENTEVKKGIFFLPDEPYYGTNTTGRQLARLYGTYYPLSDGIFKRYCSQFSLDAGKPLRTFSKGMRRQLFLALALAVRPKYLLLDEAFDGLDPGARLTFKRALVELAEDCGTTTVIASHSLRELSDICSHFALISEGRSTRNGELGEALESIRKYQIAFARPIEESQLDLHMIKCDIVGKVATIVTDEQPDIAERKLKALDPLFIENVPIDFEDYFLIYTQRREK